MGRDEEEEGIVGRRAAGDGSKETDSQRQRRRRRARCSVRVRMWVRGCVARLLLPSTPFSARLPERGVVGCCYLPRSLARMRE